MVNCNNIQNSPVLSGRGEAEISAHTEKQETENRGSHKMAPNEDYEHFNSLI